MSPQELKRVLESGLLSFPLTDFDDKLRFAPKPFAKRLEWLMPYGASALFAAGGTGEFFSIEPEEYAAVIKTAITTCKGKMPIIASAGGGTTLAVKYAQQAERLGAQGRHAVPHPRLELPPQASLHGPVVPQRGQSPFHEKGSDPFLK